MKIIVPISSYPTRYREFQKNSKIFLKIKKIPLWLLFQPKPIGTGQKREKIKTIVPISSYPTHYREFQKNSKKIKKHNYGFFCSQNRLGMAEKERK